MGKFDRITELVEPTDRDSIGEPTHGLTKLVILKYTCPYCGFETTGSEDVVKVVCPNCEVPMIVKREENMENLKEVISSKVKRLRELVEEIDPTIEENSTNEGADDVDETKKKKSEQDDKEDPEKKDDKQDDKEDPEKKDDKEEGLEEGKKKKSEQDDKEDPEKKDDKEDDDKDRVEEPSEKKAKKSEQVDGELEILPNQDPEKKDDKEDDDEIPEQDEEPKGEVDLGALLDFLNSKTGVAYEITNAVFSKEDKKLTVDLTPDIPPEITEAKDELADIFGVDQSKVKVSQSSIEVKGVNVSMPEDDDKDGFPGIKTKDMTGTKVHFVKSEGEEDRLACPAGYKAEDGKCVPIETPSESKGMKESFSALKRLL